MGTTVKQGFFWGLGFFGALVVFKIVLLVLAAMNIKLPEVL